MAKDKEILDALKDDKSQRFMAATLGVSRNTAAKVIQAYQASGLSMDKVAGRESDELHRRLFPGLEAAPTIHLPDYVYVHKELLKPGGTLKLLWNEYSADCKQSRLLHLQHKPGDKPIRNLPSITTWRFSRPGFCPHPLARNHFFRYNEFRETKRLRRVKELTQC